jgi:hypothetical protein
LPSQGDGAPEAQRAAQFFIGNVFGENIHLIACVFGDSARPN